MSGKIAQDDLVKALEARFDHTSARVVLKNLLKKAGLANNKEFSAQDIALVAQHLSAGEPYPERAVERLRLLGSPPEKAAPAKVEPKKEAPKAAAPAPKAAAPKKEEPKKEEPKAAEPKAEEKKDDAKADDKKDDAKAEEKKEEPKSSNSRRRNRGNRK